MAIADTINSIRTHLETDYEALENIGAELENVDKNIENIASVVNGIYDNLPKTTGEDTSLSLTTLKGKMNIIPKGDTQQTTTTGKNLLDITATSQTLNGVTFTINEDKSIKVNGTASANTNLNLCSFTIQANTNYFLSGGASGGSGSTYNLQFYSSPTQLRDTGSGLLINRTADMTGTIRIQVMSGTTINNLLFKPMLELGSSASEYEPYTGNSASPNPTYPQNIEVVTGTQEVKVENKNLLDYTKFETSRTAGGVTFTNNNDGTIKLNGTSTSELGYYLIPSPTYYTENEFGTYTYKCYGLPSTCKTDIYYSGQPTGETIASYNINVENRNYAMRIVIPSGITLNNVVIKPMLVKGNYTSDTFPSYVEHQEQTQIVSLGDIELCKIGTYQDYLYKSNGKWYKKEQIGKTRLTGTAQTWASGVTSINEKKRYYTDSFMNIIVKPSSVSVIADILNNYYKPQVASSQGSYGGKQGISVDAGGRIYINDDNYQDNLDGWKTWLNGVTCELYYALQTANDIQITNETLIEQLDNIEKLMSYNSTTNINSSGNLPMILNVSALKGE